MNEKKHVVKEKHDFDNPDESLLKALIWKFRTINIFFNQIFS